jgi:hypothetical protein
VRAHAALRDEFLALPATSQAREVILAHKDEILYVDVEDRGILQDVDDGAAYQALIQ